MQTVELEIAALELPSWNPRLIREHDFERLVQSIKDDPELLKARPVIVNTRTGKNVVIAGNMRVRACQHLSYTTVPCILVNLTEEQEKYLFVTWLFSLFASSILSSILQFHFHIHYVISLVQLHYRHLYSLFLPLLLLLHLLERQLQRWKKLMQM